MGDVNSGRLTLGGLPDESGSTVTLPDFWGGVFSAELEPGDGVVEVTGGCTAGTSGGDVGTAVTGAVSGADTGTDMTGDGWGTGSVDMAGGTGNTFSASKGRTGGLVADTTDAIRGRGANVVGTTG